MSDCLFCKIARGEIPCKRVFEDEDIFAFHDIHPITPVHFMIIPKLHIPSLTEAELAHTAVLGKMLALSGRLAREQGLVDGFRSIINTGRIGRQEVYHLHMHILGGPEPLGAMIRK